VFFVVNAVFGSIFVAFLDEYMTNGSDYSGMKPPENGQDVRTPRKNVRTPRKNVCTHRKSLNIEFKMSDKKERL